MSADALSVLLKTRLWVRRRVDRVEFLDLMTVRRTIALTLDLGALADVLPRCGSSVIPLGWFVPWANAGAELIDADRHVIPYLTSEESDSRVQLQIKERLRAVGITDKSLVDHVDAIRLHRKDAGQPGYGCKAVAAEMRASVDRDGADVDARRLMTNLQTVASERQALQPSGLRAAVSFLVRLASDVFGQPRASDAPVDAIDREYQNVVRLACDYQSRLRRV